MAVVINEFAVVPAEPTPAPQNGETTTTAVEAPPTLSAHEVAWLVERERERALRVWAH
jgi:hypothetical protein